MRLDLAEGDAQRTVADDHLAGSRANDVPTPNRRRELALVTRQRPLRQRPRHLGKRYTQRMRRPRDGERRRRFCVTRAAGERERYCNQRKSTSPLTAKTIATAIVTRV